MSLDQLESFVVVAETGSVMRAARQLHISQPPLSRKIRAMEDELGTSLFERLPRGMRLTEEGQRFLPHAKAVLVAVEAARGSVQPLTDEAQATSQRSS